MINQLIEVSVKDEKNCQDLHSLIELYKNNTLYFFGINVSKNMIMNYTMCCMAGMRYDKVQNGDIDYNDYHKLYSAMRELSNYEIYVSDKEYKSFEEFESSDDYKKIVNQDCFKFIFIN